MRSSTESLNKIRNAYEVQDLLIGTVSYIGKAYLIVKVYDYPCIMLKDEIELFPVKNYSVYHNKEIVVRVVSIQQNYTATGITIFVSHKSVAEDVLKQNNINSFNDIKKNHIYKGIVKDYKDFGVFVTLGIIDGLVPKKKLPIEYSITPENFVTIGSVVEVKVINKDYDNNHIFLCIPSLDPTLLDSEKQKRMPFEIFKDNLVPNESIIQGRVVFLERDQVTLHVDSNNNKFTVYIKREDLTWERVQNTSDVVFLGEVLSIKYLYYENGKLYFDLKWQHLDIYPKKLFSLETDELLSEMHIYENKFLAKVLLYHRKNINTNKEEISGAFATNLIAVSDDDKNALLVDNYTGANIKAFVPRKYAYGLENGKYYLFKLVAASKTKRIDEHCPFMFSAILDNAIPVPDPYKELIDKSFKENKTPKSNRESASYLKEIGADMYADRDRMFYELLQNADDSSSLRGVKVMVQIKDNYLIFSHDGLPFSIQDFRSIVSTAYSTKRLDRKKTGYKGIGFKSVFTDSNKVFIRTGGFFFLFDKNAELFKDFRAFYRFVNPLYTNEQFDIFLKENSEYEKEFEGVEHLPWQLLPFWINDCPEPLLETSFARNCNVAIALDMGVTAENYKETIKGIIQNPRFMLFLRNTLRIQYEDKKWDILSIAKQTDNTTNVVRLKNSFASKEKEISYIVREGSDIPVSNEAFEWCNIPMIKKCKEVAGREKWYMYQIIDNMQTPITSLPERIIAADTTTISYAFMLNEYGSAVSIPDKTPSLYAYLPMEDRRYLFPFFINADFELSSNRQEAKRVSVWNEYLFYNIGKNIVSWVSSLAKPSHPSYLSLLPNQFFTEELEEGKIDRLAAQFNRGYKEALAETSFILNDKSDIVCQKDIVIDESGFANVIGSDDFCRLLGLKKRLPHKVIDIFPLMNKVIFADVEHFQTNQVVDYIVCKKNRKQILRYWCGISPELRTSTLLHIVNMSGNKKNLFDSLLDIPAYSCSNKLLSFNKLLKSDNIILNCEIITGIEDILTNLNFKITDEVESEHPFHEKISEELIDYNNHVFDIIAKRTSTDSHPISASDKVRLFKHFISAKIDYERLSLWGIFCNQDGSVIPLSKLTHIDSSLYNDITMQFVIEESEYTLASHIIDRYLMKEKDQYEELIINNWDKLASEVGEDEEKACSLYQLATTTFMVAEHEQAKDTYNISFDNKKFVYAKNQWFFPSEAIINSKLAENKEAKTVVELLTGKKVPSQQVTEAVGREPFDCKNQMLEKVKFLPETILNQEQTDIILKYCLENQDTVFINYYITETEEGVSFKELAKGCVVAYTDDEVLHSFIQSHCKKIMLLPKDFSGFKNLKGILSEDKLLLHILNCIKDVKAHETTLLPIYRNSISQVKTEYINHLSSIDLNEHSCTEKNDICIQTLLMASTIEKPDASLFDNLRDIIFITSGTTTCALSKIKLEHTIEVGGKKYPLSKLLPNEDKMAVVVDTLKERIAKYVPVNFIDNLFEEEVDNERADSAFSVLNKTNVILENGTQVAFIIDYANSTNNLKKIVCEVFDVSEQPSSYLLNNLWYLQFYSFIEESYILNSRYSELEKYISLPFTNTETDISIHKKLNNFEHIKESLNQQETFDLLDFILQKKKKNQNISSNDIDLIKKALKIADSYYIVSDQYSLEEEKLPDCLETWRKVSNIEEKTEMLRDYLGIICEDSDIIRVRAYLTNGGLLEIKKKDSMLSELTCNWISNKNLILNDKQFLLIRDFIDEKDVIYEKDVETLNKFILQENNYMGFSDYNIYLFDGEMPWYAKFKSNNYRFHNYHEGDIALYNYNIFINERQIDCISELIRSLVNIDGFTANDLMDFSDAYNAKISGSLEGEIDTDPDEDARSAASEIAKQEAINWLTAKGYNTADVKTEYSFINGVKKNNIEYHIVVKGFKYKAKELKLNPNEWLYLLKEHSRLMLYMGHMNFAVIDRKALLGNHDFLILRLSTSNFNIEGNRLDEVLSHLAKDIQYFERTHFVFKHIHDNILSQANSLDSIGFYKSNTKEIFTPAKEEDVL